MLSYHRRKVKSMARKKIEDGYKTPQDRYRAQNIKRMEIKLDIKTDGDILAQLEGIANKQGYIKSLIRQDIKKDATNIQK